MRGQLETRGFKLVKPLEEVAGAYHSRLMESAREAFAEYIRGSSFPNRKLLSIQM